MIDQILVCFSTKLDKNSAFLFWLIYSKRFTFLSARFKAQSFCNFYFVLQNHRLTWWINEF